MGDSFLKKEISFGRKKKVEAAEPVATAVDAVEADAPKQSSSFLKKEISFSRKPKAPKEPKAAKQPKEPKQPKEAKEPKAAKQSFLKKEISFGKSKEPKVAPEPVAVPEPKAAKQSFLKKEISFGKSKEPKVAPEPVAALEPKPAKRSFFKKELSFGKSKEPKVAPEPVAAPEPKAAKQSFLKKDLSFSRKKKQTELERLVSEAEQSVSPSFVPAAVAPVEAAPTAIAEAAVAAMVEAAAVADVQPAPDLEPVEQPPVAPAPEFQFVEHGPAEAAVVADAPAEPVVAEQAAVEPVVAEHAPAEPAVVESAPVVAEDAPAEPEPVAPAPVLASAPEPVGLAAVPDPAPVELHAVPSLEAEADADADAEVQPVQMLPVDEAPAAPISTLSPAILAASVEEPVAVEPVAAEPVAYEPEPVAVEPVAAEPVAYEPEPVAAPAPVAAEPVAYEPEPVAAAAPAAVEPVAVEQFAAPVAPPVEEPAALEPVAEAPVEAWAEPAAPAESWLAEPELPPAPELPAPVVVHPPVTAAELPPLPNTDAKSPFWKKELSFSRKPKAEKAPKAPKVPKGKKAAKIPKAQRPAKSAVPWWKKELGGKKKSQVASDDTVVVDAPTEALPVAAKAEPFWKKMSLSMPSMPSRSGGKGGHSVKKLVGLKIGSSQLAAARVSNNGVAEVLQLSREALAPGVVVGGELRDPDALGEALKGFFARNKLPKKGVRLGIASNRIGVRIFDIVGVTEDKQLANAVHFRAQEALPIPLDEAVLDYRVLDESVDEEGQTVKRVLLVVVYRELVDRYVSACKKAGITLAGIDLEAFALLRSLAAPEDRGSSALVAVSIGYDRSTFAVSDGRVCEFTRVLEWGGSNLNVALARIFDSTPSEVEGIKRGLSLDGTTVPPGLSQEQTAQALEAIRRQVQSFARELVSSLQFYQNQPGSLGIGEIVLTGGTTHLHGLAEELERLIGVHVRVGDPLVRVKISKKIAGGAEQVGSMAVAIGLGIED